MKDTILQVVFWFEKINWYKNPFGFRLQGWRNQLSETFKDRHVEHILSRYYDKYNTIDILWFIDPKYLLIGVIIFSGVLCHMNNNEIEKDKVYNITEWDGILSKIVEKAKNVFSTKHQEDKIWEFNHNTTTFDTWIVNTWVKK